MKRMFLVPTFALLFALMVAPAFAQTTAQSNEVVSPVVSEPLGTIDTSIVVPVPEVVSKLTDQVDAVPANGNPNLIQGLKNKTGFNADDNQKNAYNSNEKFNQRGQYNNQQSRFSKNDKERNGDKYDRYSKGEFDNREEHEWFILLGFLGAFILGGVLGYHRRNGCFVTRVRDYFKKDSTEKK